jgi:predicted metalloprotease with PDZ domain
MPVILFVLGCMLWGISPQSILGQESDAPGPVYEVDLTQAITHYITIKMTADAVGEETQIMMPTWTPGSYLVREYARHIDRIEATDSKGKNLPIEKISKNRWVIQTGAAKKFSVKYRLFCDEASVRTNLVDINHAVLNGAATFVTIPEQLDRSHSIQLTLPDHWSRSATSLLPGKEPNQYLAEDFDEVVDSPIVAGNVLTYPFEVAGVKHYLVNVNQKSNWNAEQAIEDLAKVVQEHHKVWGVVPYDRYYFLNVFGNGGGGLEHNNSCLMMTSQFDIRNESSYQRWLSLASHEFFHTWNIRRLRPKALVNYDYENEVYTPSLWIAEGITSYYEDLMLVRAGLLTEDDFIEGLGRTISNVERTQGRLVQSLRDSSHDAWIKFYRPSRNSGDTQISYYTKGAVVGFLLDTKIRSASAGKKSLDDVLREFWAKHAGDIGYEPEDFRELCSAAAGENLDDWFRTAVDSTNDLEYQNVADWYGLDVGNVKPVRGNEKADDAEAGEEGNEENEVEAADDTEQAQADEEPKPSAGNRTRRGRRWIGIGEFDSPATLAGIADTDEIIAINDRRTTNIDTDLQRFKDGEPVKVLLAREGEMREILVVVGLRPEQPSWGMKVTRRPTKQQKENLKQWLDPESSDQSGEKEDQEASPPEENSVESEIRDD